ncbi:MAG: transporter [Clostridia bacterium]|nr:transporter [Clostridia bacterium]
MKTPAPQKTKPGALALRVPLNDFLLLHATFFLYAVVSIFGKSAGNQLALRDFVPALIFLGLEAITLAVYAVLWQQTLKRMDLSYAYSNKGVVTLWSCLFGLIFFGETLTWGKAIGILVVLAGVWLVVSDHD